MSARLRSQIDSTLRFFPEKCMKSVNQWYVIFDRKDAVSSELSFFPTWKEFESSVMSPGA